MILNLLIKPSWLVTELMVQDRISHEGYGIYAALFSLSFLFTHLADSGINLYVTKRLANDKESMGEIFSTTFSFKVLACIIYPVLMIGIGYVLGYRGDHLLYLYLLALVQSVLQAILFLRANFQAFQMFRIDALASVTDKAILLALIIVLLNTAINLPLFIYAILISAVLTFLIYYAVLIKTYGWIRPTLRFAALKNILARSLPFAMIGILYAINERIDMVMLERLGGEEGEKNAGLYAAAYRWLDVFMMYLWTILPMFFAKFALHDKEPGEQQKIFNFGQILTFFPLLFAAVFVMFYGEKFFWVFKQSTPEELAIMTSTLKILFLTAVFQGMFAIYGTYLNSTGHEKKVSFMITACILLNIVLNAVFIPSYGPIAAAYATLASTVLISVLYLVYIPGNTLLKIPVNLLGRIWVIAAGFVLFFYILYSLSIPWFLTTIASGLFLTGIMYITNTGNIKSVFNKS